MSPIKKPKNIMKASVVTEDSLESVKSTPVVGNMVKFKSSPDPKWKNSFTQERKTTTTNLKIDFGQYKTQPQRHDVLKNIER